MSGNLYVADKFNLRIRKITSGIIATIAGKGGYDSGFTGDGGPAYLAGLSNPYGVGVDRKNNVYIADTEANRVRAVFACVSVGAPRLASPANGASGLSRAPSIAWEKVDGAFRYDLYLSATNPPALIASDLTATTYAPANLPAGATYYFRVVAKGDPFCVPVSTASSETRSFSVSAGCEAPGAFDGSQPADGMAGQAQSLQLAWQSAPGAAAYDLYFGPSNPPALLAAGLGATSYGVSALTPFTTYYWSVAAHASCDASKVRTFPVRSFRTAGACTQAGSFSLSSPADRTASVAAETMLSWTPSSNVAAYDVYLGTSTPPSVYAADVPSNGVAVAGLLPSRTYYWRIVAKVACDASKNVTSPVWSFTTAGGCSVPAAPRITFVPPGNVGVGQTYTVAWEEIPDLDEESFYIAERSLSSSFTQLVDTQQASSPSASFLSNSAGTYHHRVRAVRGCDPSHPGPSSDVKSVNVVTGTANVIFTLQPQAVVTALGDKLEDKKATLAIENLGASTLQVILGKGEINSVPFFAISDPSGGDSVFVTLEPKKPKTFEVRFSGPSNSEAAAYQGLVFVAATGQGLAITPYAFVNLKVGGGTTARPVFMSGGKATEYAFFPGFSGDDASRPGISVDIRNNGGSPMELGAEIGPEVWLVPESGWNATPIPAGSTRSVKLRTQRNRAPNGSALPRYTYFTVRSKNGETARLLVQDNDDLRTAAGRSSFLEPGSRSYIVPGVMSATSPVALMSRLQLTNVGSEAVQADLLFTPAGADGFDASVRRATVVVPPNDVVTLTNPLVQVFGLTPPARGQIEVRAAAERIGFLIVAGSTLAPSAGGGSDRVQLATLRLGEGARVGSAHAIVDVSSSGSSRAALTLAETSGTEATRVRVTLFDGNGSRRGETSVSVPRYGEAAIDLATIAGGTLEGGRIQLAVESGGGAVAGVATMLDATRNTGVTVVSQPEAGTTSGQAMARIAAKRAAQTSGASAIIPLVLNGLLSGVEQDLQDLGRSRRHGLDDDRERDLPPGESGFARDREIGPALTRPRRSLRQHPRAALQPHRGNERSRVRPHRGRPGRACVGAPRHGERRFEHDRRRADRREPLRGAQQHRVEASALSRRSRAVDRRDARETLECFPQRDGWQQRERGHPSLRGGQSQRPDRGEVDRDPGVGADPARFGLWRPRPGDGRTSKGSHERSVRRHAGCRRRRGRRGRRRERQRDRRHQPLPFLAERGSPGDGSRPGLDGAGHAGDEAACRLFPETARATAVRRFAFGESCGSPKA